MNKCDSKSVEGILVKDLMTTEVVKVKPDDSMVAVGGILSKKRISGAVVMDSGKIAGVVSKESFVMGVKYMGINPLDSFKVRDFMTPIFETAQADELLSKVVDRVMTSPHRVDRVLVLHDGVLSGILTTTDIARIFAERARGCLKVRDLMQINPAVVHDYTPVHDILREITLARDKRVIVMAGTNVLGVITVLDLSLALFEKFKEHKDKDVIDMIKLEDLVTLNPVTITDGADAAEAARLMVEKKIGGLPVFDGVLKGVITKNDIIKGFKLLKDSKEIK